MAASGDRYGAALGGQAGYCLSAVALFGPVQGFGEVGGVEPGWERPGQPAGPEQAGVAVGDQVTERDEPDHQRCICPVSAVTARSTS